MNQEISKIQVKIYPGELIEKLTQKIYELVYEAKTNYEFKSFVVSILSKYKTQNTVEKAQILLSWFQNNIKPYYQNDLTLNEEVKSPLLMLKEFLEGNPPYGDCDDFVCFYASMLESVGIITTLAYPFYNPHADKNTPSNMPNHVIVCFLDRKTNKWFVADPTSSFPVMTAREYNKKVAKILIVITRKVDGLLIRADNWA